MLCRPMTELLQADSTRIVQIFQLIMHMASEGQQFCWPPPQLRHRNKRRTPYLKNEEVGVSQKIQFCRRPTTQHTTHTQKTLAVTTREYFDKRRYPADLFLQPLPGKSSRPLRKERNLNIKNSLEKGDCLMGVTTIILI